METKKLLTWDALIEAAEAGGLKETPVSLRIAKQAPESPLSDLARVRFARALGLDLSQFDLDNAKIARLEIIEAAAAKALGDVFAAGTAPLPCAGTDGPMEDEKSLYERVAAAVKSFASTIYGKVTDFAAALWGGAVSIAGAILALTGDVLDFLRGAVERVGQGMAPKPEPVPAAA